MPLRVIPWEKRSLSHLLQLMFSSTLLEEVSEIQIVTETVAKRVLQRRASVISNSSLIHFTNRLLEIP
jgi:hypothetical protein